MTTENAGKIFAKVVLEGANIPITAAAETELSNRGVLCLPDVIANAGGVICAAAEYRKAGYKEAFAEIEEKIRDATSELLDRIAVGELSPRQAVEQMARDRLRAATRLRRKY